MLQRKEARHIFVIIAIGANLPAADGASPLQTCCRAALAVAGIAGLSHPVCSRWFSTGPIPASAGPRYINGVVRLNGWVEPAALLQALQSIEQAAGRTRSVPNAPRTLDLDIIDMATEQEGIRAATHLVRAAPDPVLPHPRAHLRAFVLRPLRDVAPDWRHPVSGAFVQQLIDALPPQDIHAL